MREIGESRGGSKVRDPKSSGVGSRRFDLQIFFNSVDHDGARKGYDLETIRAVTAAVDVPLIAFGGVFTWSHLLAGIEAGADAVAAANIFHYTEQATRKAKTFLANAGVSFAADGRSKGRPGPLPISRG